MRPIAEAVAYADVTIALAAGLLSAEPTWPQRPARLRLARIAAVTVALAVADATVPTGCDPVWRRLRGLACLLSVLSLALFAEGLADWVWHLSDQPMRLVTAGPATAYSLASGPGTRACHSTWPCDREGNLRGGGRRRLLADRDDAARSASHLKAPP